MRLIADYEVPHRRGLQSLLEVLGPRQHVEACNDPLFLGEEVTCCSRFDLIASQDIKQKSELLGKLVLPLFDQ
jgi:hypothetical protein